MNISNIIANVLGMHIGCMVKNDDMPPETLTPEILVELKDMDSFKDCKLLLTPLDKITEEDWEAITSKWDCKESWKAEKFEIREKIIEVKLSLDGDCQWYTLGRDEVFLLASKGYDIGIVEDEYKEITE